MIDRYKMRQRKRQMAKKEGTTKTKKKIPKDTKLKVLKELRVVLHDIADSIPLHQRKLLRGWKNETKEPCINTSTNSSNNIRLKQDMKIKVNAVTSIKSKRWKTSSKNVDKIENTEKCIPKSQLNGKDIKPSKIVRKVIEKSKTSKNRQYDQISQLSIITQKSGLTDSNGSSDEKYISNLLKCNVPKTMSIVVPTNTVKCRNKEPTKRKSKSNASQNLRNSNKSDIIYGLLKVGFDDTNSLNKKTLTFLDCNSKIQEIPDTFITLSRCDNGTHDKVEQRQSQKQRQNRLGTSDVSNTNFKNNKCISRTLDNIEPNVKSEESSLSDRFCHLIIDKNSTTQQDEEDIRIISNNETASLSTNITTQTNKSEVDATKNMTKSVLESAVNNVQKNISESLSVSESAYSTSLKTNCVTETFAKLPKTYDENESTVIAQNLPKITQDCLLPKGTVKIIKETRIDVSLQNNSEYIFPEQNKYNDSNENIEQTSHIDEASKHINIFTKEKNDHTSSDLKNKISNVMKISDCTLMVNNNSLILKDKNMLDNEFHNNNTVANDSSKFLTCCRKRTAEKNNTGLNLVECENNKKIKLNRTFWLQNNATSIESVNDRQSNDIQNVNTTTIESNITSKNIRNHEDCNDKKDAQSCKKLEKTIDLRQQINAKRCTNLSTPKIASENNNTESERRNVNNMNDIVFATNAITKNEKISDQSSSKEMSSINKILYEKKNNIQVNSVHDNDLHLINNSQNALKEMQCTNKTDHQIDLVTPKDANIQKKYIEDANDDDDYISLFAEESFDGSRYEDMPLCMVEKPQNYLCSETPYRMSSNSIDRYIKQNTNEFNNEYAECMENEMDNLHKCKEKKKLFNKHQEQTLYTDDVSAVSTKLASPMPENMNIFLNERRETFDKQQEQILHANNTFLNTTELASPFENADILSKEPKRIFSKRQEQTSHVDHVTAMKLPSLTKYIDNWSTNSKVFSTYFCGKCFTLLKNGICCKPFCCHYKHNVPQFIETICSKDSDIILNIIKCAIDNKFYFFFEELYLASLTKLDINQILITYKMLWNNDQVKEKIIDGTIEQLLQRKVPLTKIVNDLVVFMPIKNSINLKIILQSVEVKIKPGEYWNIVKPIILELKSDKDIIEKILHDCIKNKIPSNIQDINTNLISKLDPNIISTIHKSLITRFKHLVETFTPIMPIQNFGENSAIETIASPDSRQSSPTMKSPKDNVIIRIDANNKRRYIAQEKDETTSGTSYRLQPIDVPADNLKVARSFYTNHINLWKFYVDLDRFIKGLQHKDYDYVIEILEYYTQKKKENKSFISSCCSALRLQIKRSEYHLSNVIRRTVQTGTSGIVGKILFDISLDTLARLVDEEAWGLALWFISSLNIYDSYSSHNAGFILLSAEIYLANKKIIKAFNLLKHKNIIRTSHTKWCVKSIVKDEYIRNKIMYILMDALCIDFIDHAFFLFKFLLGDQSSQYYPIDLSRYVDKLIILILTKNDTNLIKEMGNLILQYNFTPTTTIFRALISTLIHVDNNLTKQLYNYAEAIGIYAAIKLWPITQIIINTDLTEEELYLMFLQLLDKLVINFGHTIEFIKPQHISVYLILEVKGNEQFYCAELQSYYNNQAIANIKRLIKATLKNRFSPSILLTKTQKGRICKLQSKSLINYLKSEHCS